MLELLTAKFPYESQVLPHEISVVHKEHYTQLEWADVDAPQAVCIYLNESTKILSHAHAT
jgi:hypothetical protein